MCINNMVLHVWAPTGYVNIAARPKWDPIRKNHNEVEFSMSLYGTSISTDRFRSTTCTCTCLVSNDISSFHALYMSLNDFDILI